jgi:hypothetical protein
MSSRSTYLVRFMPKKVAIRAALVNVEAQPHIEEAIHLNLKVSLPHSNLNLTSISDKKKGENKKT